MVEGNRYIEQYARMNPRERNVELRLLYEQLPASLAFSELIDQDIPDESRWSEDRRVVSEHKRIIMDCFEELLRYSYLTDMGKIIFLEVLGASYNVGSYKHIPEAIDAERIRALGEKIGLDSEGTKELQEMGQAYARAASTQGNIFLALFDYDDPDNSAGIFDLERTPLLERQFYEWYKDYSSPLRKAYMDVSVEHVGEGEESRLVAKVIREEYQKLEKWEEELGILTEN